MGRSSGPALPMRPSYGSMASARSLRWAVRLLPWVPPALAYPLCEHLGSFAPYLPVWPVVMGNMRQVRPRATEREVAGLARGGLVNLVKNYYELLRVGTLDDASLAARFQIEGLDNGLAALARGKGVLAVTLHTGNFSLALQPVAHALGINILAVVEQMHDPAIHEVLNTLRQRRGITIVPANRQVTRPILAALAAGDAVVLAQDRLVVPGHTRVDFFGIPTNLPVGAATLALRTGAALVPVYVARRGDNRFRVVIDPPIQPARATTSTVAVQQTTQALVRVLEGYIQADPAQWVLTNRVWDI